MKWIKLLEAKIDWYRSVGSNYWLITESTIKICQDRYKELTWHYYKDNNNKTKKSKR